MNKLTILLRRIPLIRRLDDWSETPNGESICWAIIILFLLALVVYNAVPMR